MRDRELDELFGRYRSACPEPDGSVNFLPAIWQKIEARQSFWLVFDRFGRTAATASAAICLLLLALNLFFTTGVYDPTPTYTDALMADHSAEKTDYAEAIRTSPR